MIIINPIKKKKQEINSHPPLGPSNLWLIRATIPKLTVIIPLKSMSWS